MESLTGDPKRPVLPGTPICPDKTNPNIYWAHKWIERYDHDPRIRCALRSGEIFIMELFGTRKARGAPDVGRWQMCVK
jgi:hypothetical protein